MAKKEDVVLYAKDFKTASDYENAIKFVGQRLKRREDLSKIEERKESERYIYTITYIIDRLRKRNPK